MELLPVILFAGILAFVPGVVAERKGYSFLAWYFFGLILLIVALPTALLLPTKPEAEEKRQLERGMKKCPFCAELIKPEARLCRYCSQPLEEVLKPGSVEGTVAHQPGQPIHSYVFPPILSFGAQMPRGTIWPKHRALLAVLFVVCGSLLPWLSSPSTNKSFSAWNIPFLFLVIGKSVAAGIKVGFVLLSTALAAIPSGKWRLSTKTISTMGILVVAITLLALGRGLIFPVRLFPGPGLLVVAIGGGLLILQGWG